MRDRGERLEVERAEKLGKGRTEDRREYDLPPFENGSDKEHGEQVKKPKVDVALDDPIDGGNGKNKEASPDKHRTSAALQTEKV